MPVKTEVEAPAKVNLSLEVLERLPSGYHRLDTVFCWLELADRLSWRRAETTTLTVHSEQGGLEVPADESNLVLRALRAVERHLGQAYPLELRLEKQIPAGGGLGGGSSDAAALLYGLHQELGPRLALEPVAAIAAELGADVAFCVRGGTARGRDRGQQLESLPEAPALPVILLLPDFGCPTGSVYRLWDPALDRLARGSSERVVKALESGSTESLLAALANDLEPAARRLQPALIELEGTMTRAGCDRVLLSGSGSTLLGWCARDPQPVVARLRQELPECRVLVSRLRGGGR